MKMIVKNAETILYITFNEDLDVQNFQISIHHLFMEQKSATHSLISKLKPIFVKNEYDTAHIDLKIVKYCSKTLYICSIEDRIETEKQISELIGPKCPMVPLQLQ